MKKANLQDIFLTKVRKQAVPVTVFLMNGFQLKEVSSDITVEGPASVLFSGSGRVLDNKGAAISSHQVYRISRSSAEKALCVFVTPGGGVKLCNPALASGEPFACQPQISLVKCPKA